MIHVFIVGSKGIPARYGGFETFIEQLTLGKQNTNIKYHVSCMNNEEKHFEYNDADCFNVRLPLPGAPGRIFHVGLALRQIEKWLKEHKKETVIVYILGCRIGPLLKPHSKILHKLGAKVFCNPDGLEWKRDKWNSVEKKFLKYCEKCLVLNSDLVICDSVNIEKYIHETYGSKCAKTTYIAYGADTTKSTCSEEQFGVWCDKFGIVPSEYYLVVGRFVPENNYECIITEFMKSKTKKKLVVVTNIEHNKFYYRLFKKTQFYRDNRIIFAGTIYAQELLKKIRENAFAYIHGHEVGGTNPSLLEAMASTRLNLLYDVAFNREVAGDGALYWNKNSGALSDLIFEVDGYKFNSMDGYKEWISSKMERDYSWDKICNKYEKIFERGLV